MKARDLRGGMVEDHDSCQVVLQNAAWSRSGCAVERLPGEWERSEFAYDDYSVVLWVIGDLTTTHESG